jgi:hypothetical protein
MRHRRRRWYRARKAAKRAWQRQLDAGLTSKRDQSKRVQEWKVIDWIAICPIDPPPLTFKAISS